MGHLVTALTFGSALVQKSKLFISFPRRQGISDTA